MSDSDDDQPSMENSGIGATVWFCATGAGLTLFGLLIFACYKSYHNPKKLHEQLYDVVSSFKACLKCQTEEEEPLLEPGPGGTAPTIQN